MIVYDLECYPNFFSCCAVSLDRDDCTTWEISDRRNDKTALLEWLHYLATHQIEMCGFNNIGYDYILIHELLRTPITATYETIYAKSQEIFASQNRNRWALNIWPSDRIIPQIDLFKIWHFDNQARSQSLKGLEHNMRSPRVVNLPIEPGTMLTSDQMDSTRTYGEYDTLETRRFARISLPEIDLRRKLRDDGMIAGDVLNFNATKLGKELLIQRLGHKITHERKWTNTGFNGEGYFQTVPRQTIRTHIPLRDVIFPYIKFEHPEFQRVHQWMLEQTLEPDNINPERATTKGVFKGVSAIINGFQFNYGTGGIHGSLVSTAAHNDADNMILDADVASLYPSIAIVNRMAPAHLGEAFIEHYAALKIERFKHKKGTPGNAALKLGLNGSYGDSNNIYSPLYDPAFTMGITLNGQLLISMLAELLIQHVPSLKMLQVNTDGLTVKIPRTSRAIYNEVCKHWENFTLLELEFVEYKSMWIRDVNNYVAIDIKGKLKTKGAYWTPDIGEGYAVSMSGGPGHWHQPINHPIVARAAIDYMTHDIPLEVTLSACADPFEFLMVYKSTRGSTLYIGETAQQKVTRYYVSRDGGAMVKVSPPVEGAISGAFKRKNGVSHHEYNKHNPFIWNAEFHTGNRSKYDDRKTRVQAGWLVTQCNDIRDFNWGKLNYDFYQAEAEKLVIR